MSFDRISVSPIIIRREKQINEIFFLQRNTLSVKPVGHLIHCCKKKNVYRFSCVIIAVRVISFRASRLVFKLKSANVQQHERKQHKTRVSFFFSWLFFPSVVLDSISILFISIKAKHGKQVLYPSFSCSEEIYVDLLIADE